MMGKIRIALQPAHEPYDTISKIKAVFGPTAMRCGDDLFVTEGGSNFIVAFSCRMPHNVTLVAKSSFKISANPKFASMGTVLVLEAKEEASLPTLEFVMSRDRQCLIQWWFDYVFPYIPMPLDVLSIMAYLKGVPSVQGAFDGIDLKSIE
jgi:hypothetical protein